jgi:hypothetical protein
MTRTRHDIPFNRPAITGDEWKYMAEAIRRERSLEMGTIRLNAMRSWKKSLACAKPC